MTSDRSYRKALPLDDALAELRRGRGSQFDPRVVDALVGVVLAADGELLVNRLRPESMAVRG